MQLGHMITAKDRYTDLQTVLGKCGSSGCLFLCLCSIAEEQTGYPVDLINIIKVSLKEGWLREDFYIRDSLAILEYLTGKIWTRRTVPSLPPVVPANDYTVAIYHNDRTGFTHYKRRGYDTLRNSITVKEGTLMSYYVYTWRHS